MKQTRYKIMPKFYSITLYSFLISIFHMPLRTEPSQTSLYMQNFCLPHKLPKTPIFYGIICLGPICSASAPDPALISFQGHLT